MSEDKIAAADKSKESEKKETRKLFEAEPIITRHEWALNGKTLRYTATAGTMPLKDDKDELEASIFYVAYTLNQPEGASPRPLIFVFNGGPGSASIWLHLGAVGPWRVKMADGGFMPPAPYSLVENEGTWLDLADLVFIDPVGTGFSRSISEDKDKKYWNVKGDIESIGEFIRLYLTRNKRWSSPLFLAGESYGSTRAAGLAGHLVDRGIAFNGVILISCAISFTALDFATGNELPFALFLPTYAATAWYHKKLPADLQKRPLREVLEEVEAWAESDYIVALMKGDRLTPAQKTAITRKLARYSGLPAHVVEGTHQRILIFRFCKELMRAEKRSVGRIDSRYVGIESNAVTETPEYDPSLVRPTPPFSAAFNHYVRDRLGYQTDLTYETLSYTINEKWEWEKGEMTNTGEALRSAMAKNPFMKIFVAQGYYDLATPHFATEYMISHMNIDATLRANVRTGYYESGHMFYLDLGCLAQFKQDVTDFMDFAWGASGG